MGNEIPVQRPKQEQTVKQNKFIQIAVIGETYVGKTCLARTYESGVFEENRSLRVGASRHIRKLKVQNKDTDLVIWNVSGQQRYRPDTVVRFVHLVEGVLLLYDVANIRSFWEVPEFLEIVRKTNPGAIVFIIGARADLVDRREVSREVGQIFADSINLEFFECSAKTGENVNEVFEHMTFRILQKRGLIPPDKKEICIEGKYVKWDEEKQVLNTTAAEEESIHGSNSEKEVSSVLQQSLRDDVSGLRFCNLRQGLETPKTSDPNAEEPHPGSEISHALMKNEGNMAFQSRTNNSSEPKETCPSFNGKKDVLLKEEKSVVSEEEILLEGKCPSWLT